MEPIIKQKFGNSVSFHHLALSDQAGEMKYYINNMLPASGSGLTQIVQKSTWTKSRAALFSLLGINPVKKGDSMFKEILVKTQTLDAFTSQNNIERINLLKIDVEGAELMVLRGAFNLLNSMKIDIIQIEILDKKQN